MFSDQMPQFSTSVCLLAFCGQFAYIHGPSSMYSFSILKWRKPLEALTDAQIGPDKSPGVTFPEDLATRESKADFRIAFLAVTS